MDGANLPYSLELATAATFEPVAASDFESWGRDTTAAETSLYTTHLPAARQLVEDFIDRWLTDAVWDLWFDEFPDDEIWLPRGPWRSITYVKYNQASDGVLTTWDAADYQTDLVQGRIKPAYGESWPSTRDQYKAVVVRIAGGYVNAAAVPQIAKTAIQAVLLDWVQERRVRLELPPGVKEMLMSVWSGRM